MGALHCNYSFFAMEKYSVLAVMLKNHNFFAITLFICSHIIGFDSQ